jgi:hypothetical protein
LPSPSHLRIFAMSPAMGQLYALIPGMESKEKAADVAMEAVRLFLQDLAGARPWN